MRTRSKGLAAVAVSVLAAGAIGGWVLTRPTSSAAEEPPPTAAATTTPVTTQDLVETEEVAGTLGYGERQTLSSKLPGTVTWLAPAGGTVTRGATLFRVDQRPVTLLYGAVPMYRTLSAGVEGADVEQLERNLRELGYAGFTVDDEFTASTADAVEEWQEDLGRDETGKVQVGEVVFAPGGLRIAAHRATVGGASGGAVLDWTATTRVVTVPLPVADQRLAVPGGKVTVELPGGATTTGKVTSIGTVAEVPAAGTGAGAEEPSAADATVDVRVTLDKPAAAGKLDEAPVTVRLVSQQRKGVLTVPVSALLALKEGGYGLEVVAGGNSKVVAVETGMFAAGRVEVKGAGIAAGTQVGVPAT